MTVIKGIVVLVGEVLEICVLKCYQIKPKKGFTHLPISALQQEVPLNKKSPARNLFLIDWDCRILIGPSSPKKHKAYLQTK